MANIIFLLENLTIPSSTLLTPHNLSTYAPKKDKCYDSEMTNKPLNDTSKIERCRAPRGELQDKTAPPRRKQFGQ